MKGVKDVWICSKRRQVIFKGRKIPRLLLGMLRGTIGKSFVVKHYRDGKGRKKIVITHYPDMRGIEASEKQRARRNLFKEAVVYAQWILADKERKKAFKKSLPRKQRKHVYQAAIRLYMRMQGDGQWLRKQLAVRSMMESGRVEVVEAVRGETSKGKGVGAGVMFKGVELVKVNGRWGVVKTTRVTRIGMVGMQNVDGVNGWVDLAQWEVIWRNKELVDKIPLEVVEPDVGACHMVE